MKVLLIDDSASEGWEEILAKILFINRTNISSEDTVSGGVKRVENEIFDLIFLDLRFGEVDHAHHKVEDFGGYKILKAAKSEFAALNFPTPVVLFTATNKIWNIDFMVQNGVDDYYIKEHPDFSYDLEFTRKNYQRLISFKTELLDLNSKRRLVWNRIQSITENSKIQNENIQQRIEEKLKIGYGILFRNTSELEKEVLLFNSEVIAFIVFWSILEEFVKDCFKDHWDRDGTGMQGVKPWELKNGAVYLENNIYESKNGKRGNLKVAIKWNYDKEYYEKETLSLTADDPKVNNYTGTVNLREQIWATLLLYKNWHSEEIKKRFKPLREYRNKIDFIHSSTRSIFEKTLESNQNNSDAFKKVLRMLEFLEDIITN